MGRLNYGIIPPPYMYFENVFSDNELENIIKLGSNIEIVKSLTFGEQETGLESEYRHSKNSWIHFNDESSWIYAKCEDLLVRANNTFFNFDIDGFEPFQYTIYEDTGSKYDYHIDSYLSENNLLSFETSPSKQRKLSMVIQLNDPSEYEGGELQIMTGENSIISVKKEKGFTVFFPSFLLHRVTPITHGVRKSLVGWAQGSNFK